MTARFPLEIVEQGLFERERDLSAHVKVYYAIAPALYAEVSTGEVLHCLLEGVRWLDELEAVVNPAGQSGISQARTRLGAASLEALYRAVVQPGPSHSSGLSDWPRRGPETCMARSSARMRRET